MSDGRVSRNTLRHLWLKVHRYIAFTLGAWFVLLGLTGACNVFYPELEEWGLPDVTASKQTQAFSLDRVLEAVKAAHPHRAGRWTFQMPGYGQDYLWVVYPNPEETADEFFAPLRVFVNPYSGEIVAENYWGRTLWSLIYEFHADLLTGKIGPEIGEIGFNTVSLCGLFLFVSAVSGLYLWWPRQGNFRTGLTFKRNASPTRFNLDLHRITGFYGSLILIILSFTGFSFAYAGYIKPLVNFFSEVKAIPFQASVVLQSKPSPNHQPITIARAIAIADRIFPEGELRWLATPETPEDSFSIRKRQPGEANRKGGRSQIWIDQYSGEVLAISDPNQFTPGETFLNLMWPLHNGEVLGFPGKVIWCAVGFFPLVLFVTGMRHWLAKRRAKAAVADRRRFVRADVGDEQVKKRRDSTADRKAKVPLDGSFRFMQGAWPSVIMASIAGLSGGLASAGIVALINQSLIEGDRPAWLPWLYAVVALIVIAARIGAEILVTHVGQRMIYHLRLEISRRILAAPLSALHSVGTPRLLAALTEDITTVAVAVEAIPWLCVNAAIVLGCMIYMGWLSWILLVLVCGAMLVGITGFRLVKSRALGAFRSARRHQDEVYSHFRGLTDGIKELKLNRERSEAFFSENLAPSAEECQRHTIIGRNAFIVAANSGNGLFFVTIGMILFGLPGAWALSGPTLTGFVLAFLFLMAPLAAVVENLPVLGRAGVAVESLKSLGLKLLPPRATSGLADYPAPLPDAGQLKLADVTHRYQREAENESFTLGPINLTLCPGEVVFLVGGNGCGKTTLALVLTGLYSPESGEICLDGQVVNDANREQYRQHFATVFSDFYLFDSLLGFHNQELDAETCAYLAQLQLNHKVRVENGVFSTLNLSQGQRKRLALLIAYLEDRPYYVFDEWAADQDPVFKRIFYMEIVPALKAKGKAVVVITHDDAYFHVADRCLKLENGTLSELRVCAGQREAMPDSSKSNDRYKSDVEEVHE